MPILSILSDDMRNINLGSTPFSFRFSDETLGLFLKFHLTAKCKLWTKSTAISANSIAQEVEKQVINEPRQWQCLTKCCIEEWNWKEQMRNIGPKEIQVNNRNKSNWTLSLQKGGQIGGWRSGGPSAIMCDENFHQIGTNLSSTHIRFQSYPILPVPKLFWPWKWASKLKSHFLRGSFSRLTFKSGGDPV